jgi:tetratricopeptide (TPR) repeat protein
MIDQVWTYFIVVGVPVSDKGIALVDAQFLQAAQADLEQSGQPIAQNDGYRAKKLGNILQAEFANPWQAIEAALRIHTSLYAHRDGRTGKIGIDVKADFVERLADSRDLPDTGNDQPFSELRAKRIMEACPNGHILCSEDLLKCLDRSQRDMLEVHGPFYVKLRNYRRPAAVHFIGHVYPAGVKRWQTGPLTRAMRYSLGPRGTSASDLLAKILTTPFWLLLRNTGRYESGKRWFSILNRLSRWLKWRRLELHSAIGLSDVTMLLRMPEESLEWTKQTSQLAHRVGDRFYQAMANYQVGHHLAHVEPTDSAASFLQSSYALFEDLADARMAGWSALYLGRCLRGLKRFDEAGDWILASVVIASTIGHERQIAYALAQLARLRIAQGQPADAKWYLDRANNLYPQAVSSASDDAPWEPPLSLLHRQVVSQSSLTENAIADSAHQLVDATLGSDPKTRYGVI